MQKFLVYHDFPVVGGLYCSTRFSLELAFHWSKYKILSVGFSGPCVGGGKQYSRAWLKGLKTT